VANTAQAAKRARQNEKRRLHNMGQKSAVRTNVKKALKLIGEKKKDEAVGVFQDAAISLDRLASKKVIHRNKAARLKSRLNAKLKAI
jgi:small subunit ribosomal protein S20